MTVIAPKKADEGKPRFSLVPRGALWELVAVLEHGVARYGLENWRQGEGLSATRLLDAAERHLAAVWRGEDRDPDSGCLHLMHAACSLFFLAEARLGLAPGIDDRPQHGVRIAGVSTTLASTEPGPTAPQEPPNEARKEDLEALESPDWDEPYDGISVANWLANRWEHAQPTIREAVRTIYWGLPRDDREYLRSFAQGKDVAGTVDCLRAILYFLEKIQEDAPVCRQFFWHPTLFKGDATPLWGERPRWFALVTYHLVPLCDGSASRVAPSQDLAR